MEFPPLFNVQLISYYIHNGRAMAKYEDIYTHLYNKNMRAIGQLMRKQQQQQQQQQIIKSDYWAWGKTSEQLMKTKEITK